MWMNLFSFFTQVAIIFACTRAVQDISYSYLPLFLTDSLDFQKVCADFTQLSCYDTGRPLYEFLV